MAFRAPLSFQPPPPMAGSGPCRADKFLDLSGFCPDRAARRVVVGMNPAVGVCFWHSLQAVQLAGAHLVRDLPTPRKPRFLVFPASASALETR